MSHEISKSAHTNRTIAELSKIAHLMDEIFVLPGTQVRFGLDGIIGLIPGIGDLIGAGFSFYIVYKAALLGAPVTTLARMALNIIADVTIGAIPLAGDIFDIGWKANRKNLNLLDGLDPYRLKPRTGPEVVRIIRVAAFLLFSLILISAFLVLRAIISLFSELF